MWSAPPLLLCLGLVFSSLSAATPESQTSPLVKTSIDGVDAYLPLPAGIDVETAGDQDLIKFGISPRPRKDADIRAWAHWRSVVELARHRIIPRLEKTNTVYGKVRNLIPGSRLLNGLTSSTSENWSGFAIVDSANSFGMSSVFADGRFIVPEVSSGCEHASPFTYYMSANWVGLDGFLSPDVLQAGTATDLNCISVSAHYAWIEWFPNPSLTVTNLGIRPGDLILVDVEALSHQNPNIYTLSIYNKTTRQSFTTRMQPPPGVQFTGDSAEWILERPNSNGTLANLTNVHASSWDTFLVAGQVSSSQSFAYYPSSPGTLTSYGITMIDNSGTPLATSTLYSNSAAGDAAWFSVTTPY